MSEDKHKRCVRRIALSCIFGALIYVASYCFNSFFGGYWIKPEMDGRDRWSFGGAMHDAIMWQPLFGHEAIGYGDYLGVFYAPLIRSDRKFVHPTIYIYDDDGYQKLSNLEASQVHPHWRDEVTTKITVVATRDESEKVIRCTLRYSGSHHPRGITEIWIPRELANASDVSPPNGFTEQPFEDHHKYYREHYVRWVGKIALPTDRDVIMSIPAKQAKAGAGRIRFYYQRTDDTSHDFKNFCSAEPK